MISLILLLRLLNLSANFNGIPGYQDILKIGDFAHGGIIFYLDKNQQHGLVCSIEDQGKGILFKDEGTVVKNGKKVQLNLASKLCSEYSYTEDGELYNDWRLPTKDELFMIYQNKDVIEKAAIKHGGTEFQNNTELSPTEFCNSPSWDQEFNYGYEDYEYRKMKFNVRAVRSF